MLIKVNDQMSVNVSKILPRDGKITDISIATQDKDTAGGGGDRIQE